MSQRKRGYGNGHRRFRWPLIAQGIVLIAGFGLYLLPPPAAWIERNYSRGIYPVIQRTLTFISNLIPIAICDVLILLLAVGVPVWLWIRLKRAGKGRWLKTLPILIYQSLVGAALALLIFQLVWGLNYSRVPLTAKLDYDKSRISFDAVNQLTELCVSQLNNASAGVHAGPWPSTVDWETRLKPSFEKVVEDLGTRGGTTPGHIKHSLFNFYLAASGIDGFINPYGLESILNKNLLPVEQPFAIAHEWSHLAGFADESEANFIALLTCLRSGDGAVQYAGWLALYPNLPDQSRGGPQLQLAPAVLADLIDIDKRLRADLRPWINAAQWQFYDRFLKANHVAAGVASYGLFVRLVAGTKFDPGWVPLPRTSG